MRSANVPQWRRTPQTPLHEAEWKEFLLENCSLLFQTALLLSADPRKAEAALVGGVEDLDLCQPPSTSARAVWEIAVVMRSIAPRESGRPSSVHPFIQPALWPVIEIDRTPRLCFILRLLLGYPLNLCAYILGVDESRIPALLEMATLQLQHGTAASS